jgi:hypothetical protein
MGATWSHVSTTDLRGFNPTTAGGSGVSDHGGLGGLTDDDHTQYPLVTDFEADRATIQTNWTDLTDAGASTLHKHDHGGMDGLGDDDHSQYFLQLGRAGGQFVFGGTAASDGLDIRSTLNATKGTILFENGIYRIFGSSAAIRHYNTGNTDYRQDVNNGTDMVTTFHQVRDWQIGSGLTGEIECRADLNMYAKNIYNTPSLFGRIDGFHTANTTTDSAHDISIGIGYCEGSLEVSRGNMYFLTTGLIKRIDAAWAVGTNQGGMATGAVANHTEYNLILLSSDTTATELDVMFDVSATGANAPSGWTAVRRLGSVFTDGSANIHAYFQEGDEFEYLDPIAQISDTTGTLGTFQTSAALKVPPLAVGRFFTECVVNNTTRPRIHIRDTSSAAAAGIANVVASHRTPTSGTHGCGGTFEKQVDNNRQIDYTLTGLGATPASDWGQWDLVTRGWKDLRGRHEL